MTAIINRIGQKISGLLGETTTSLVDTGFSDHFDLDAFCETFPYRSYSSDDGVYFSENSVGFVLRVIPTIGADKSLIDELSGIFEKILREESALQFLLIADHRIADYLLDWEGEKQGSDVLKWLAERRCSHYCDQPNIREFSILVSYSEPLENKDRQIEEIVEKKKILRRALSNRLAVFDLKPERFLTAVRFLVDFRSGKKKEKRSWDPLSCLSKQIGTGGSLEVREDRLIWKTDTETHFKSFRAVGLPEEWDQSQMQQLIGDVFRESYRLKDPFYIHYGVYCPKQSQADSSFRIKSQIVENQGRSGFLLRMLPELSVELQEVQALRTSLPG